MPWQECNSMDERLRFVARLLDGEKMAALTVLLCVDTHSTASSEPPPA